MNSMINLINITFRPDLEPNVIYLASGTVKILEWSEYTVEKYTNRFATYSIDADRVFEFELIDDTEDIFLGAIDSSHQLMYCKLEEANLGGEKPQIDPYEHLNNIMI